METKILFTGALYGLEKIQVLTDSDLFVLPSYYDTFPVTILEACLCNTPILTTNNCGLSLYVNQYLGKSVNCNSQDIAQGIYSMLTDKEKLDHYIMNNKKNVIKDFNIDNIVKKLEFLYKTTIGGM